MTWPLQDVQIRPERVQITEEFRFARIWFSQRRRRRDERTLCAIRGHPEEVQTDKRTFFFSLRERQVEP